MGYDWRLFGLATLLLWAGIGVIKTQPPDYGDWRAVTALAWVGVAIHLTGLVPLGAFLLRKRWP